VEIDIKSAAFCNRCAEAIDGTGAETSTTTASG